MSKRSFAGYLCEESLSVGLFGECFRAKSKTGAEARVIVIDERLSKRKSFANALARHGSKLSDLVHPHIVTTEKVGRGKDGAIVVIASAVEGAVELSALMEQLPSLPQEIGLGIAMGALRGLSHAHEHQVTHGGVHPRSVLIDKKGLSKLSDFGLARALATAAAGADDSELLAGLRGYVAPELALGQEPDVTSDVYAAGALVSWLLWRQQSPPAAEQSALGAALRQAVETSADKRFPSASEMEASLRKAIDAANLKVATAAEVATFLRESASDIDSGLDAATEDLLASLGLGVETPAESPAKSNGASLDDALAGLSDEFLRLEDSEEDVDPAEITVAEFEPESAGGDDYEDELTTVDAEQGPSPIDPVEALIRDAGPAPDISIKVPQKKPERSRKLAVPDDYDTPDETPLPVPRPFHQDHTHFGELVDAVGRQAATSSPFHDDDSLPQEPKKSNNTLRWMAVIVFVLAGLGTVAYTKADFFSAAQRDSEEEAAEALRKIEEMQPKPGQVSVISKDEDAAVWLLLGRTPATSFPLPSSMVHELRLEHEGFAPLFLSVAAQHWGGVESARQAVASATLRPQSDPPVVLPAFPPVADPPLTAGGPGQGVVRVESQPEGAEVWMLVGTTPSMSLTGVQAGKDYEFKVLKDGHRPAFAAIKAEEWYLSGKEGPMRPGLIREVTLEPLPESAEGPSKAGDESDQDDAGKRRRRRKNRK